MKKLFESSIILDATNRRNIFKIALTIGIALGVFASCKKKSEENEIINKISGTVRDTTTGLPIPDIIVEYRVIEPGWGGAGYSNWIRSDNKTDVNGNFEIQWTPLNGCESCPAIISIRVDDNPKYFSRWLQGYDTVFVTNGQHYNLFLTKSSYLKIHAKNINQYYNYLSIGAYYHYDWMGGKVWSVGEYIGTTVDTTKVRPIYCEKMDSLEIYKSLGNINTTTDTIIYYNPGDTISFSVFY